jgi:hypothetical protein
MEVSMSPRTLLMLIGILGSFPLMAKATPCPSPRCSSVQDCQDTADWVIEGTVTQIIKTGTFVDCETVTQYCGNVAKPERIVLENVKLIRGKLDTISQDSAEISRQSHCFSGPLAMSAVDKRFSPYLDQTAVGRRFRFYGDKADGSRPFWQTGFLVVEPAE